MVLKKGVKIMESSEGAMKRIVEHMEELRKELEEERKERQKRFAWNREKIQFGYKNGAKELATAVQKVRMLI